VRRTGAFILMLFATAVVFSADDPALKPAASEKKLDDAAAQAFLNEVAARFKENPALKAKIVTEVEDLIGKRTEEGELLLDRPGRVLRKFTKPALKYWVLNGSYIQEYVPRTKKLYVKDFSKAPRPLSLVQAAVTVDVKALSDLFDFHVFQAGEDYRLVLIRRAEKQSLPYKRIQARIAAKGLFFHEIEYFPESGDAFVEKYLEIAAVPKPKDDDFNFEIAADANRKTDVVSNEMEQK
jgi:outer membrane lipoprotein-sorting protein